MRWTKGKPATQAPVGKVVLVAFDDPERPTWFATMKATHGWDRYGERALTWAFHPSGAHSAWAPSRFWLLPGDDR